MKNLFVLLLSFLIIFGCKSSQITTKGEIELPFVGDDYQSNKDVFRTVQTATSPNQSTAKKIALDNAKVELATNIQTIIKTVTDNYTNQRTVSDKQDFESKFEQISRAVTKQILTDVKIIGERGFKENGKYIHWIAIEMNKNNLLNKIEDKISKDEKLHLDFDKHQYEKILEKEMEEFDKNNKDTQ